jgi:hypothetical protein
MVARPLTVLLLLQLTAWNSAQNLHYGDCHPDNTWGAKLAALVTRIFTTAVRQSLQAKATKFSKQLLWLNGRQYTDR